MSLLRLHVPRLLERPPLYTLYHLPTWSHAPGPVHPFLSCPTSISSLCLAPRCMGPLCPEPGTCHALSHPATLCFSPPHLPIRLAGSSPPCPASFPHHRLPILLWPKMLNHIVVSASACFILSPFLVLATYFNLRDTLYILCPPIFSFTPRAYNN